MDLCLHSLMSSLNSSESTVVYRNRKVSLIMKRTLFALGMLLLLALFLFPSPRASAASHSITPNINFGDSCGSISVDSRGVLHAVCKRRDGSLNSTSLGLDQHVGNINGTLTPNSSHFTETCIDVGGNITLSARCRTRNGSFESSTLNLNNFVDNTNGFLVWVG